MSEATWAGPTFSFFLAAPLRTASGCVSASAMVGGTATQAAAQITP